MINISLTIEQVVALRDLVQQEREMALHRNTEEGDQAVDDWDEIISVLDVASEGGCGAPTVTR